MNGKPIEDNFLLPIRVFKAVYRGKLQAWIRNALERDELILPPTTLVSNWVAIHRGLYQKAWSVRIQEKYDHGRGVALYLARYMKGGPIKPAHLLETSES